MSAAEASAAKERISSWSESPSAPFSLAARVELAENSRLGFTTKKINSHQGWSEVNFKTATGIQASLRPEGIRSRCQSLNRYAYVLNNPTTLIDPLGLESYEPPNSCGSPFFADSHAECAELPGGFGNPFGLGIGVPIGIGGGGRSGGGGGGGGSVAGGGGATTSGGSAGAAGGGHLPMTSGVLSGDYGPIYPPSIGDLLGIPQVGGFGGCDFGVCAGDMGAIGFGPGAVAVPIAIGACVGSGVCEAVGAGVLAGAAVFGVAYGGYQVWKHFSKGGQQNVGHDYVRDEARQLAKELNVSYCQALQIIYQTARATGDFKKANDTKATQKQDGCRSH